MNEKNLQAERIIFSVSELNLNVRTLLEGEFPLIWVEGEISNLAQPASGHLYFTLKDAAAQVSCAMFRGRNQYLRFKPENGQQVLVRARVSLYEARGNYQLIAEHMEEAGAGALQRAFDELKARLAAEGLFDEDLKLPIPELPERIGIITSATGAAIQDVLKVLERRFPAIPVLVYPVPVQGNEAAPAIVKTLKRAAKRKDCDVLLLVRGGGSMEDLWAFNEEIVARAIVDCDIPIICGVGHEVDVTIADFAADMRAPTPSAAAELISPDQQAYIETFIWYQQRLGQLMLEKIRRFKEQLDWLQKRLTQQHPLSYLQQQAQHLDELQQRMTTAWQYTLRDYQNQFQYVLSRLELNTPEQQIENTTEDIYDLMQRMHRSIQQTINNKQQLLAGLSRTLQAISPLETLSRGYAIATDKSGQTITDAKQVKINEQISIRLYKGKLIANIEKTLKS
ncbi:MAG: exodeoxyribonuclease VII large subunit [Gammaproteobacteria bacterium]|nr:exodeoxyribonuclease VII large subunit [Gammaproteobacteria bacterium]MCW8910812.1 exodeoxyribonuclease VII large subunit [Gammaproteobacteria bacterium]MCW9005568.1 exodeoxyribonuclease VII large subunit [Gammaproteobacteria bacterium]